MKNPEDFPVNKPRRISRQEVRTTHRGIEERRGQERKSRGRPAKEAEEKFIPISIRLHPLVLEWAKREAKKRGCGYQTVISMALLRQAI